jgi:hypothetical protein
VHRDLPHWIFFYCQCITHFIITRENAITNPSSPQLVLFTLNFLTAILMVLSYPCMKGFECFWNAERPRDFAVSFNLRFKTQDVVLWERNPSSPQLVLLLLLFNFPPYYLYDLLINPFCNDLSHNLSFWHLNTHSIIDPNIEKFQKGHRLGHKMFENVRLLLYKENNYNGV